MADLDKLQLETRVAEMLHRRPAVGMAVGVVREGALQFFSAHGVADVPSRVPVTDDTVFRIGSITKTMTAIAAMQLVEQGLLDLDAPANDYLRAYRLVPRKPGWRQATQTRTCIDNSETLAGSGHTYLPRHIFRRIQPTFWLRCGPGGKRFFIVCLYLIPIGFLCIILHTGRCHIGF